MKYSELKCMVFLKQIVKKHSVDENRALVAVIHYYIHILKNKFLVFLIKYTYFRTRSNFRS